MKKIRSVATWSLCVILGLSAAAVSTLAAAKPATKPASPATKPVAAVAPSGTEEFTSPAEIMRKLKAERDRKAKMAKVVYFNLFDPVAEHAADFSLFGDFRVNLRSLLERLDKIKNDGSVKGVLITFGDPGVSLSQAQEVRDALAAVVKSGKPVFVHADGYDTTLYTM